MFFIFANDMSRGPGSARLHAEALEREGVPVEEGSLGDYFVSLDEFGWFPRMLPSYEREMAGGGDGNEDEEE